MNTSPISLAFKKCRKEKRPALLTYKVAGDNTKKKISGNIKFYYKICRYM